VRKPSIVVIFLMLAAAPVAQAQDAPRLSLDDAIRLALANNRSVANAALNIDKAANDVATARSRRLPQFQVELQASQLLQPIDMTFPRGAFGTFEGIGPIPGTDATVTTPSQLSIISTLQASQPITQLFKLNLNVALTEASKARAEEQLRDTQLALVSDIKRIYYDIVQTQSAYESNQRSIALLEELNRVVAARLVQQVALKSDALNTEAKLARAEVSRVELQDAIDIRKEQLNQLIGRDVRTPFSVSPMPEAIVPVVSVEAAQARAIDARPDVRQARLALTQAELSRRVAKTDFLPELSIGVSFLTPMNINGAPKQIASAALQMKWEVFDWGRKGRALASKDVEVLQAQNSVRDTEDRAALDLSAKVRAVETARARLKALRAASDAAHESARIALMQYSARAALFADVLQTQSSAADADYQIQQALATFWAARADLERAMAEGI
jgi:outer membrane protein TolC